MNITFLIGNGFDLNLGLETTYESFYKNYVTKLSNNTISNNLLYKNIKNDIDNWADFETRLGLITFPPSVNEQQRKNLLRLSKFTSSENNNIEDERINYMNISNKELLSALIEFRKDFKKYLTSETKKLEGLEKVLGEVLSNGVTDFFSDYNDDEKIRIYSNIFENARSYNGSISDQLLIDYSFITFNYTEFLETGKKYVTEENISKIFSEKIMDDYDRRLNISANIGQINHVHSKLSQGMFLGVDNDSQLYKEKFTQKELSTLIKPLSNQKHNSNIINRADKQIEQSNMIVIYGTALGATDLTWWKKIISFLMKKETNIVLIHKFDSEINTEEDDFFVLEDIKDRVKDHLLSFDETLSLDEIANLKNKIFVNLNSESIFNSKSIKRYLNRNESPSFSNLSATKK